MNIYKKKQKIILFGAGLIGKQVLTKYLRRFNVIAFVDNDPNKLNSTISDIDIIHPEELMQYKYDYIVITSTSIEPIKEQLIEIGIDKNKITQYIDHVSIIKNRFPFDAVLFILLCIISIFYFLNIYL